MPEINPRFMDAYEVTATDLQSWADNISGSEDHIVLDAVVRGRRYVGFTVTGQSSTSVKVTSGRLYDNDGLRFFRDDPGGLVLDLNSLRPPLQNRVVSIVAYRDEQDGALVYRYHETDPETGTKVSEQVVYTRIRKAKIEAVPGIESASPQPAVVENALLLATLVMSPAGIVPGSIVRNTDGELPNLCDLADTVKGLDLRLDAIEPIVSTLSSDLAKLQAQASAAADRALLYAVTDQLAIVQKRLDIPALYTGFRSNDFVDDSDSNTGAVGYAARTDLGLRLPFAASDVEQLALFNEFEPNGKVSGTGLLLPKYNEVERRIVKGAAGTLSLARFSNETRTLQVLNMGRTRTRFGGDFEESANGSFFVGGVIQGQPQAVRYTFLKDGETYQVEDTGRLDAQGNKIKRVSKYWSEQTPAYWSLDPSSQPTLGYAHFETWLNTQDGWCTAIGPDLVSKPSSGLMTVGICKTYRGEPDLDNVIAMATLDATQINLGVGAASFQTWFPIDPTFLEGGTRYAFFVVTPAAYEISVANADIGASGSCFYATNGGVLNADPSVHLLFRLKMASFPKTNVDIEFQALQLAGGIQMIDVLTDGIVPAQCDLAYGVQLGGAGAWRKLDPSDPDILNTLPVVVRFRASFLGTQDVMPGIRLAGSQVRFSRLATAGKHIADLRTLSAPVTTITLKGRVKPGFDPAHHTYVPSIRKADGTPKTADAVTTTIDPDGTTIKTAVFNMSPAVTQYASVLDYTTDAVQRPLVGGSLTEIAV